MFELKGKYATAKVYADIIEQEAISQIIELCNHPMFENAEIAIMPDCHSGKGCVIGFTAVLKQKMVVPNLVGVDIACGVNTSVFETDKIDFKALDDFIRTHIPHGFGIRNSVHPKMDAFVRQTVKEVCEEIQESDSKIQYHLNSGGSLGGGNHYIEIGRIHENKYALSVHCGSRNLGKRTCEYFQNRALLSNETLRKNIIELHKTAKSSEEHIAIQNTLISLPKVPKELGYLDGTDYERYIAAMAKLNRFAAENRRLISDDILRFLGVKPISQFQTIHNYVEQRADGTIVIRKGAIRAEKDEMVAIPLNMRDGVIIGVGKGNADWNCSAPHGAGRLMSRSKAKESVKLEDFQASMNGINTWSVSADTLDESPQAYKPADEIINAIKETVDIQEIIKPIYNFKAS